MNFRTTVTVCIALVLPFPLYSDEPKKDASRLMIEDGADLFSPEGIQKAQDLAGPKAKPAQQILVLTVKSLPEEKKADYEKAKNKMDFGQMWCKEEAAKRKFKGLLVLICVEPPQVHMFGSTKDLSKEMAKKAWDQLAGGMQAGMKPGSEKLQTTARDKGLLEAVQSIKDGFAK